MLPSTQNSLITILFLIEILCNFYENTLKILKWTFGYHQIDNRALEWNWGIRKFLKNNDLGQGDEYLVLKRTDIKTTKLVICNFQSLPIWEIGTGYGRNY